MTSRYYLSGMARITVYIPDDLLERAKVAFGDAEVKTSQLVQRGLEGLLRPSAPAYAVQPDDATQLMSTALMGLLTVAEEQYQAGWRAALSRVPDLPLWLIEHLADTDFSVRRFAAGYKKSWHHEDSSPLGGYLTGLAEDIGSLIDPVGFDQFSFRPTEAFMNGYEAALREMWSEYSANVNEPQEEEVANKTS